MRKLSDIYTPGVKQVFDNSNPVKIGDIVPVDLVIVNVATVKFGENDAVAVLDSDNNEFITSAFAISDMVVSFIRSGEAVEMENQPVGADTKAYYLTEPVKVRIVKEKGSNGREFYKVTDPE